MLPKNFLLNLATLMATCSTPALADRVLPIRLRFTGAVRPTTIAVVEIRDAKDSVLSVTELKADSQTVALSAPGTRLKVWWICEAVFDTAGIGAFNPDSHGNAPRIDLKNFSECLGIGGYIPPTDTTVPDSVRGDWERWDYQLTYGQPLKLLAITRFPEGTPSGLRSSSADLKGRIRLVRNGDQFQLRSPQAGVIRMVGAQGRIDGERRIAAGTSVLELGSQPKSGGFLLASLQDGTRQILPIPVR